MEGFAVYETQYGPARIDWQDDAITGLQLITTEKHEELGDGEPNDLTDETFHQLRDYFEGLLTQFTVPISIVNGTRFQRAVWQQLLSIPYGETRTYGQIAESIGNPKAVRAVGSANNHNPITFIIPCHRVVGVGGRLVGYAYGTDMKRELLRMELRVSQQTA